MKKFAYKNPNSLDQAVSLLKSGDTAILAGGTDILNQLMQGAFSKPPATLVNIKNIPGLNTITETAQGLKIGALTKLADIAESPVVQKKYAALAQSAAAVASPAIRNMGTLGGNICQQFQCWYWKRSFNTGAAFECLRKDGTQCFAISGENQYHSIFGGSRVSSPPCQASCPGHVDISSYLSRIREGDIPGAAKILLESNPIPSITGRVCRHFCEQRCNRSEFDESVSTRDIERFLGDYILEHAEEIILEPETDSGKKVAIIGSGPAGLTAAYYLRKSGHSVTVFDRMAEPGGMLTYVIPAYRLPKDVVRRAVKAIQNIGVEYKLNVDVGKDITLDQIRKDYNSVFIATGAWKPVSIGLEGEESTGFGMDFLTDVNLGVRKAPGKKILVIGGGSAAIDVAVSALRLGAEEAVIACLEPRDEMPALPWEVEQAVEEGVKLMPSWGPRIVLKSSGNVTGMEMVRCTAVYNNQGRFAPTYDPEVKKTLEADRILMAVGYATDLQFIDPPGSLKVTRGLIEVDPQTQSTSVAGVFAGGTVAHGPATVIEAVAAGKRAALAIDLYLAGVRAIAKDEDRKDRQPLLKFNSESLQKTGRSRAPILIASERSISLEDNPGLGLSAIKTEAGRCFNCSCVAVNSSDLAPALVALGAKVITTRRAIEADEFFRVEGEKTTLLDDDEVMLEIEVPKPASGARSVFIKFALRNSIDFPVVSCAAAIENKKGIVWSARICLNAVSGIPYRATRAEEYIKSKSIDESSAEAAADAVVKDACPLTGNKHKVQIAKTLIKRALLQLS
jgi:NADPH-dependent glutamate synthase beta subunit-like oxidoreductase/CO/xanthine dehydrogenase FAD-binding subunit